MLADTLFVLQRELQEFFVAQSVSSGLLKPDVQSLGQAREPELSKSYGQGLFHFDVLSLISGRDSCGESAPPIGAGIKAPYSPMSRMTSWD